MRKFSEIIKEQKVEQKNLESESGQALILFDNVLDSEKVLQSQEIEKLVICFLGKPSLSVQKLENAEKLHDWFRDEQYKADVQDRALVYPFKARFEDLTLENYNDQFSGPLLSQVFSSESTDNNVLTLTCPWYNGIFRNDYYVIGVIIDSADLKRGIRVI